MGHPPTISTVTMMGSRASSYIECALDYAEAVVRGGVCFFEVALNSPGALGQIELLRTHLGSKCLVGAGTAISVPLCRGAVDAGWISYAHQIGQTGVTVRPRLCFLFGVSGAVQHIVGMSAAKTVVAVNTDRSAPVFRSADYGIVADWRETAGYFIQILTERKASV